MVKANVGKKGITPVIAIVLLLMMTVAAAGLAYEFIMNMSETQTEAIAEQVEAQSDKMRTDIRILQIQNTSSANLLQFIIRNQGSTDVPEISDTNTEIKLDGKILPSATLNDSCTDKTIIAGTTCYLNVTAADFDDLPDVGTTQNFEILLDNGLTLAYACNKASATDDFC